MVPTRFDVPRHEDSREVGAHGGSLLQCMKQMPTHSMYTGSAFEPPGPPGQDRLMLYELFHRRRRRITRNRALCELFTQSTLAHMEQR